MNDVIYIITTDGFSESLLLNSYATNEAGLLKIVEQYQKDIFYNQVRNFKVDWKKLRCTFEVRYEWDTSDFDWTQYEYHIVAIPYSG